MRFFFLIYKIITFIIINVSLRIAFVASHPHRFWCIVFIFICFEIFLNSFLISSWTHWLIKSILFSFHMLANFPNFLLLNSSFIVFQSEKIPGMIMIFFKKNSKTRFVAYHIIYPGEYFMCTWEYVFWCYWLKWFMYLC